MSLGHNPLKSVTINLKDIQWCLKLPYSSSVFFFSRISLNATLGVEELIAFSQCIWVDDAFMFWSVINLIL